MVVGSTLDDVLSVNSTTIEETKEEKTTIVSKEPLSKQKVCFFANFVE